MRVWGLVAVVVSSLVALSGCNACEKLEEKVCADLGAADCAIWKQAGGPDTLFSGRRQTRACVNMMTGPMYDALLGGARAMVDAQKSIQAPR